MTSKTQHKTSSAGADTPALGLSRRDHVTAALVAAVVLPACLCVVGWVLYSLWAGVFTVSSWSIETQRHPHEAQRRVEASAVSWVGPSEDRYGVDRGGGYLHLRLARHCDDEWSITYPTGTAALPPPGTTVMVQIASEDTGSVVVVGTVAANSRTVSLAPSAEVDEALFVDGEVTLSVKAGDRPLSVTETRLRSYRPRLWLVGSTNPVSFLFRGGFHPLELLEDACS